MITTADEIAQAAKEYAQMGFAVLPVRRMNKHPYTPHGVKDATKDLTVIREWWKRWPDANVAIACGSISGGLVVIDQDVDDRTGKDGINELSDWSRENHVEIPDSPLAITGSGGYHQYMWSADPGKYKNAVGVLEGVDIRTDGGYVVAPPSIHGNGHRYEWEYPPDEYELAEADGILGKLFKGKQDESGDKFTVPEQIEAGGRNDALFRMACSLQSQGVPDDGILAAVLATNKLKCNPPLPEDEVEKSVRSALRFQKGEQKEIAKFAQQRPHEPKLDKRTDKDGKEKVLQTLANCEEAIEFDPQLFGHIRYNMLSYSIYVFSNLPWNLKNARQFREWKNIDDSNLRAYLEKAYGLSGKDRISDALANVAYRHQYNPIIDTLSTCHEQWDGKPGHIRRLLPDFLGVEDTDYQAEVMQVTMLGAISRANKPGCKFDYMTTIVGQQGCGKSTFVQCMALDPGWFTDSLNTIEGDRAAEKLRGKWIIEVAELLGVKRAKDVEAVKSFLTSQADTYRPPYKERTEDRPRSCIFIGTTNSRHFLTDQTGNRRYLPIEARSGYAVKNIHDRKQAVEEFVQAWGEAMDIFLRADKRPPLVLSDASRGIAEQMQGLYLEEDPLVGIVEGWLKELSEDKYPRICTAMIYKEALGELGQMPKPMANHLADIMDSMAGWHRLPKKAKVKGYGSQRAYERDIDHPGRFRNAEKTDNVPF